MTKRKKIRKFIIIGIREWKFKELLDFRLNNIETLTVHSTIDEYGTPYLLDENFSLYSIENWPECK